MCAINRFMQLQGVQLSGIYCMPKWIIICNFHWNATICTCSVLCILNFGVASITDTCSIKRAREIERTLATSPILIDVKISYAAASSTSPGQSVRNLYVENANAMISTEPTKIDQSQTSNNPGELGITPRLYAISRNISAASNSAIKLKMIIAITNEHVCFSAKV